MLLINWAFYYWRTTLSIFVLIAGWGLYSFINIPQEEIPSVNQPIVNILEILNGVSPHDAEILLARPIENKLRAIDGVSSISDQSFRGGVLIQVTFETDISSNLAIRQVQQQVGMAKSDLPEDALSPVISQTSTAALPVLSVILHGDVPYRQMIINANKLQHAISILPTVLSVNIFGNSVPRVNLLFDPVTMENYHISPIMLVQAVQKNNQFIPAGTQESNAGAFSLEVPSLLQSVNNILAVPLLQYDGRLITVKDIADVHSTFDDRQTYVEYNHENAIQLFVSKKEGTNVINTIQSIKNKINEVRQGWPSQLKIDYSQDSSQRVINTMFELENNLLLSIIIVIIIVVAFLGIKNGILIGISIPGSFLVTVLFLYITHITLNIIVLFSFILAGGMLVDTTIVVIEYADKQMTRGLSKLEAYRAAAVRMTWPVVASTLTTLAAFFPLMFWPGIVGKFMVYLPITVSVLLIASTFMSLIFIPVLGGYVKTVGRFVINFMVFICFYFATSFLVNILDPLASDIVNKLISIIVGLIAVLIAMGLTRHMSLDPREEEVILSKMIGQADKTNKRKASQDFEVDFLPKDYSQIRGFIGGYVRLLNNVLKFPKLFVIFIVLLMIGTWGWYYSQHNGVTFFPSIEPSFMQINVLARGNLSAYQKNQITKKVGGVVYAMNQEYHDFKSIITTGGNLVVYGTNFPPDIVGYVIMNLEDWNTIRNPDAIREDLQQRLKSIPGIKTNVIIPQMVPRSSFTDVDVRLLGPDRTIINSILNKIQKHMDRMPQLTDMYNSSGIPGIEWNLTIDRYKAAQAGVSIIEIGAALQMATIGLQLDKFMPKKSSFEDKYKIYARFPEQYRTLSQLKNLRIVTLAGNVPMSNFVKIQPDFQTNVLYRTKNQSEAFIRSNVRKGYNVDDVTSKLNTWIEQQHFPKTVNITMEGETKDINSAFSYLTFSFLMTILLMAAILLIQFNNFFQMTLVLSAVIMSTTAVGLYMAILHTPFGVVMQGIAAISLAGIVVNNNIVLIDTYNALRKRAKNQDMVHVILSTCGQRLRPVLLTAGTTILGLLPVALGISIDFLKRQVSINAPSVQFWVSLSSTIIVGMLFATILTLFVTPSLLLWRAEVSEKRQNKYDKKTRNRRVTRKYR